MKTCTKCQTKNTESSQFCKKCGSKLSNGSFEDKKEKVLGEKKGKSRWIFVSLVVAAIVLAGAAYWIVQDNTESSPKVSSQPKVSGRVDYTGQTVPMTDLQAKVEKGQISIPIDVVMQKKIVRFEYDTKVAVIPIVSFIAPSGRVVTAVSMCEPCRSTRFHIKEKTLVCNACYTEWNLETLQGIRGGCLNYPPDVIPSTIEKGKIFIEEKSIQQWKPRA